MKKITIEEFIKRSNIIHKNKYNYSISVYYNMNTPIDILCPIHGVFSQLPLSHLKGHECPKCKAIITRERNFFNTKVFIEKSKSINNDKYDYSEVEYKNMKTPVIIKCPIHGPFEMRPEKHLLGQGCPKCRGERGKQTKLERYGNMTYNNQIKIRATCLKKYGREFPTCHYSYTAYKYEDEIFDSSWELAFWIYCKDFNIKITRNKIAYDLDNGHRCIPDFIIDKKLYEIKGDHLKREPNWPFKDEFYKKHDVKVLFYKEIQPYLNYITTTYGRNYLKQFKIKKPLIVEIGAFS
jgi:hypothetical protein